ncbi:MAG: LysM peptidoglycan-binding domain-containing protein [Muribaculaceae bacterium]
MLNFKIRILAAVALMIAGFAQALALDLPVRKIGGRQYYVYKVHRHDNVYGVADLLGLTRDDIVSNNPAAAQGLKEGQELFFPVDKYGDKDARTPDTDSMSVMDYKVKKGETVFGISRKFHTTPEVIYELNPGAENGIKAGSMLKVPMEGGNSVAVSKPDVKGETPVVKEDKTAEKVSEEKQIRISDVTPEDAAKAQEELQKVQMEPAIGVVDADDIDKPAPAVAEDKEYTVVVMLPFMLQEEASRTASQATEFYKGMLVAAEKLKNRAPKLKIIAVDTGNSPSVVRELLDTDHRLKDADVIIAPENRELLDMVADFGRANKIYVMNVANSRSDVYLTNPYVMQGLIPSQDMLEKAAGIFVESLDGATPVILRNLNGKDDKKAFVDMVMTRLGAEGIPFTVIEYEGGLSQSELESQLVELPEGAKLVFLPTSGTLGEFNRISATLEKLRAKLFETGGYLRLFGYPEWTTFANDAKSALHELKSTIYARSYANFESPAVTEVNEMFRHWYGEPMTEGVPVQGLMGYDLISYLIDDMADGDVATQSNFTGVQSSYDFGREEGAQGVVNKALYIVEFMPGDYENVTVK